MNAATSFRATHATCDTAALMSALDSARIPSNQDWENECTAWTFDDGSQISVSGTEVSVTSKATYTVAVGRSWHSHDNTPAPDYTCGHAHKSQAAADACGAKLYGSRYVRGSWQANARWHDYYIINNATGHKVSP